MQSQIDQLYNPLFYYVKKRVNNHEDAEDITQDVFYKLSKTKTDSVENIKSWVYTIAKNTITDYYRKKRIPEDDIETFALTEEYDQESAAEELSKCVTVFIQELPEEYRSILTLSELEEMPQKEIAEKLDMNYVTVRSKIQRGRKKLKGLFSKCCNVKQGGKGSILEYHQNSACNSSGCPD
ncbi:sigma-70 family RNA polymerase sigma factor [Flagellimonas sp.]|uniref:sigma-70 family RNA polymerase sigma factor n=1 Tax=Flagellimonas sp. TaxID=2058762 RepID=UPI003B528CA4